MCAVVITVLAISAPVLATGTAEEVPFYSDALGIERMALVYLPEDYETSGLEYPVVYLDPRSFWHRRESVLPAGVY